MTGKLPDMELAIPGSFTLKRELSAAAASRSSNCGCGQVCARHPPPGVTPEATPNATPDATPNDSAHRLAAATIPIMTFAFMGNVFVM